ncbi:MAG TPA: thiamine pyrophosphate-binding protein [Methanotrichaceae archaeon]|nr:thiamine pyrophosphate-binding protein [Methanotrichaceae archaeon]
MISIREALYSALRYHRAGTIFHLPGSALVPLYAGLDEFNTVLMRHPASVGFAADACARLTGLGVAMVAQGPGIAGIVPALIHSWKDHVPVVIITARPGYMKGDPGAWQAFPVREVLGPVSKGFVEVSEGWPEESFRYAFDLAMTQPCGPVVIDVLWPSPDEAVPQASGPDENAKMVEHLPICPAAFLSNLRQAIEASSRPLILAGAGVLSEWDDLRTLVHDLNIPAVTTAPARGVLDEMDPMCLGPSGTIGSPSANDALCRADLILVLGSRMAANSIQPLISSGLRPAIFQIAGDPADRSHVVDASSFCVCTAGSVIDGLMKSFLSPRSAWYHRLEATAPITVPALAEALKAVDDKSILIMDAGAIGLATYRSFVARRPMHLLYQWGIASMGTSLPAAVGACFCGVNRAVVISGDGGLLAGCPEISTIAENSLPVKVVAFNNGGLQFIREIQQRELGREVDASFGPVDLASVAESFGIRAARVREGEDLTSEIRNALRDSEPMVLEVKQEISPVDLKGTQWDRKVRATPVRLKA